MEEKTKGWFTAAMICLGIAAGVYALGMALGMGIAMTQIASELGAPVLLVFLLSFSYVLGEVRAGTVPEYSWKQVVFLDDTRLDGYPLHRVSGGIIFRKRKFFSFDVGAVFIPYSSIKFITEPRRDSAGDQVLSLDYPSFIITAP